jgi:hypothetical protein
MESTQAACNSVRDKILSRLRAMGDDPAGELKNLFAEMDTEGKRCLRYCL